MLHLRCAIRTYLRYKLYSALIDRCVFFSSDHLYLRTDPNHTNLHLFLINIAESTDNLGLAQTRVSNLL